jgi:hypothetical protein
MPNIKIARLRSAFRLSIPFRAAADQANCDLLSARFCKSFANEPDHAIANLCRDSLAVLGFSTTY